MPEVLASDLALRQGVRRMRPLLGTYVEIGTTAGGRVAEAALLRAFACFDLAQRLWSFHDPASELSRLNRAACNGGGAEPVHPLTVRLLRLARAMGRASDGLFNCTVGGRMVALGALPEHGGTCLGQGHADEIVLGRARGTAFCRLARPLKITLDGIAKGFTVDLAVAALRRAGLPGGWVNAGGDLRCFGDAALPVHRREMDGSLRLLGQLRNAAIASSRASDMPDPAFPARLIAQPETALAAGVHSVLARYAWRADALTKVASQLPAANRAERIHALGGHVLGPCPSTPPEN